MELIIPNILLLHEVKQYSTEINSKFYGDCVTKTNIVNVWNSKYQLQSTKINVEIDTCLFCLEGVYNIDKMMYCNFCEKISHVKCKHKYLFINTKNRSDHKCENCNKKYINENDLIYINYSKLKMRGNLITNFSWKDYCNSV